MISYKALTSASTILEVIDDVSLYESEIFSTNGNILYPYDLETTLTATIFEDFKDVTDTFTDIRWSIFSSNSNDKELDEQWNKDHLGKNPITITKDEIDGKATIQFEAYKNFSGIPGDDVLVACNRITIVDTNDLLSTGVRPSEPYVGQVWIDSSTEPATMWMWNGSKWVQVGTVTAMVKNLIRNSAFSTYNYQYFDIVGDTRLSYTPTVEINNGKKWLNLVSEVETEEHRGIRQITDDTEKIYTNSDYSFQFLVYNNSEDSNQIKINIYSLNSNKDKTLIYEDLYTIGSSIKQYFTSFKTLDDTANIEVEILGLDESKYNFSITELALYNTSNFYPWEASPYDSEMVYDPEALFNALTYNGKIEGIKSVTNPVTGQVQYFFNASYINSGTLKGEYIDAKNLVVKKDDGTETLKVDKDGNVSIIAQSIRLASSNQTVEEFVLGEISKMSPTQLKYLLYQIEKDHKQATYEYEQYYNDNLLEDTYYNDAWSTFLDEDMMNRAKSENDELANIKQIKINADNTFTINATEDQDEDDFILGKALLGIVKFGLGSGDIDDDKYKEKSFILGKAILGYSRLGLLTEDSGAKLKKLLYYTYTAYDESYNDLVDSINNLLDEKNVESKSVFKTLEENNDTSIDDNYADYSVKNALLYKLFIVCENYVTDEKIKVVTDDWSYLDITPKEVITEVGSILSAYRKDNPDEDGRLINAFGSIANESVTAEAILNKITEGVADPENKEITEIYRQSILEQTANAINISTKDLKEGLLSSVKVSTDGIFLNSNGSVIDMYGNKIVLSSNNIDLNGYVTFNKLSSKDINDKTIIDGGYINTNSIDAKSIIAETLSADMIKAGTLSSKNGLSSFNLDEGTFNLGDKLIYDEEGNLSFSGITIKDSDLDNSLPKWIQKWTTGKTFINGDEVITPRAFIGDYEPGSVSGLTGIFLGNNLDTRNEAGEEGKLDGGIVGYYCNEPTFRLNTDGTAEFGKSSDRQIKINSEGILEVPTIYGNEISAYNLEVLNKKTNKSTLSINDIGEVSLKPKEFYLYNGMDPVITLNETEDKFIINADNITTGQMSAGCLNLKDGNFIVTDNNDNITFSISDTGNININPSEFHLNSSTNGEAISLVNGETTINANCITTGELNGERISSGSIESNCLAIGDAIRGTNNLTKEAIFSKCSTNDELINGPTVINNCTLGKNDIKEIYSYDILAKDTEQVYIQVDLKQFYNITASKIYFEDSAITYYYNIKYSLDNKNWHDWIEYNDDYTWTSSDTSNEYTLDLNQLGVTARYFRVYFNGNNSEENPLNTSLYAWELYDSGSTTTIDANGIITGEIDADRIKTNSLTTSHINISDDNFSFKNSNNDTVFSIEKIPIQEEGQELSYETYVTINPDTFILKDGIVLKDNNLNINADYINSGKINADLITAGTLDADKITVKNLTGDQINAKGLVIKNDENGKNTFEVKNNGEIIVDGGSFLITDTDNENTGSTVQQMIDNLDTKIGGYIRMNNEGIILGKTEDINTYKTIISSDKLSFYYNQLELAYISNQKMYITNAEVKEKLTIGKNASGTYDKTGFFDWTYRSNGHLSLKWRDK